MGKTQSKRSVDITTEAKKAPEDDIAGKVEKIEDLDQKQVNGDASSQENAETEKKDGDETENDKDLTTEKSVSDGGAQDGGGDSNTGQCNTSVSANIVEPVAKEDDSTASKDGNKTAEEISPLGDENSKKPKKEKVKKKWSFRSISFGRKDKQKPAKAEDAGENAAATNGDAAAPAEEGAATEETAENVKTDETGIAGEGEKSSELAENGSVSEKEVNGEKSPTSATPIEEQPQQIGSIENTTNITNTTTETISSDVTENNSTTATENNQTEKQTATTATNLAAETVVCVSAVVSNGAAPEKNGTDTFAPVDDQQEQVTDKAANLVVETSAVVAEKIKSIPNVINEGSENNGVHQNGTTANGEETETESKSQVEVIIQTEKAALPDDLVTLTTATTSSTPKTTTPLLPDPNNTASTKIGNGAASSKSKVTDSNDSKFEKAAIAAESTACILVDMALKAIEPASTSVTVSVTPDDSNVDAGHDKPLEPKPQIEMRADQCLAQGQGGGDGNGEGGDLSRAVSAAATEYESPKPPPLPVSPPPSQVSVFAFNDNNQAEQEGICTTTTNIVAVDEIPQEASSSSHNMPPNDTDSMLDLQPSIDENIQLDGDIKFLASTSELDIISTTTATTPTPCERIEINTESISGDIIQQYETFEMPEDFSEENEETLPIIVPNAVEDVLLDSSSTEEPTHMENNDIDMSVASQNLDCSDHIVAAAKAAVDELTEKAVEIVQDQKENELQSQTEESAEIGKINDILKTDTLTTEAVNNPIDEELDDNEVSSPATSSPIEKSIDDIETFTSTTENIDSIKNLPLVIESLTFDCAALNEKHIIEDKEEENKTEICSQTVVSVNETQN